MYLSTQRIFLVNMHKCCLCCAKKRKKYFSVQALLLKNLLECYWYKNLFLLSLTLVDSNNFYELNLATKLLKDLNIKRRSVKLADDETENKVTLNLNKTV